MRLRKAHRYAGLLGLAIFAAIAITGMTLNHADALGLPQRHVTLRWVLQLYGIDQNEISDGYAATGHWVSQLGERYYLDQKPLPLSADKLIGAVSSAPMLIVASDNGLTLLLADGQLVEQLTQGIATPIDAIGTNPAGRVVLRSGDMLQVADAELLNWQAWSGTVHWSRAQKLPAALASQLAQQHFGQGPSWERVLLDLHSGRLFGHYGWILTDLAAVLILLLGVSGLWSWGRQHRRLRAHRRQLQETR